MDGLELAVYRSKLARQMEPQPTPNIKVIPIKAYGEIERTAAYFSSPPPPPKQDISVRIIKAVCKHYNVSKNDILSGRRQRHAVIPRHVIFYLLGQLTTLSYPAIARILGGLDHSTVINGMRRTAARIESGEIPQSDIDALKATILCQGHGSDTVENQCPICGSKAQDAPL